jgi:hypothetical protein
VTEKLTEDEFAALDWFGKQANQIGRKALRIIDGQAAQLAEARATLAAECKASSEHYARALAAEAQLADARAESDVSGDGDGPTIYSLFLRILRIAETLQPGSKLNIDHDFAKLRVHPPELPRVKP